MSTDLSRAVIAGVDAAADEISQHAAARVPSRALADLVAVIERVEALIASDATLGSDRSAAVERIADIAFVLHEREVEASLCDALDAAVREISDAGGLKQVNVENTHQAAELLRDLSRRVNELIALAKPDEPTRVAEAAKAAPISSRSDRANIGHDDGEETAEDDLLEAGLFEADVPEDDEFAQVVATLTAALPSLAEAEEPLSDAPSEITAAALATSGPDDQAQPPPAGGDVAGPKQHSIEPPFAQNVVEPPLADESFPAAVPAELALPQIQVAAEPALADGSPASLAGELSETAAVLALPAPAASLAAPAAETAPQSAPEHADGGSGGTLTVAFADEADGEKAHAPPSGLDDVVVHVGAEANAPNPEPSAHSGVDADDGSELFADAIEEKIPPDTGVRAASVGEAERAAGTAERSLLLLPAPRPPAVGPEEDPGDLFEPAADSPIAAASETATPAAKSPGDSAQIRVPRGAPAPVATPEGAATDRAAVDASLAKSSTAISAPGPAPAPALPQSSQPQSPQPQSRAAAPAPQRPAANDPLAPVRALSEEEMIALFT